MVFHTTRSGNVILETNQGFAAANTLVREEMRSSSDPVERLVELQKLIQRQLKAEKLLKDVLGKEQYQRFLKDKEIIVPSKLHPHRQYVVKEFGKVDIIEKDELIEQLCLIPTIDCPSQDSLAMKKLLIEGDETLFLKTANHFKIKSENKSFLNRLVNIIR